MSTLIAREMSPSVRILSGRVMSFKKNQIVLFTIARTTATMITVIYPSTLAPGVMYAAMAIAIPDSIRLMSTFI